MNVNIIKDEVMRSVCREIANDNHRLAKSGDPNITLIEVDEVNVPTLSRLINVVVVHHNYKPSFSSDRIMLIDKDGLYRVTLFEIDKFEWEAIAIAVEVSKIKYN